MEPVGTLETWRTNGVSDVDETPRVSIPTASMIFRSPDTTPVLSERTRWLEPRGYEGPVWVPWAFLPARSIAGSGVTSVGLGAIAAGIVIRCGDAFPLSMTNVLPARGVFGFINPGQLAAATTPLWDEVGELHLVTPGMRPRVLRLPEISGHFVPKELIPQRTHEALSALTELMQWLVRSRDEVANICNFSLRASRYWDSGMTPRPSTVRHLFDVHSFVESLVDAVGAPRARAWLDEPIATGALRFDDLRTPEGLTALLRGANELLFVGAPLPEAPVSEVEAAVIDAESAEPYRPAEFHVPPRRPRRPPPRGA